MTFVGRASSIGLVALLLLTLATPLATPAAEATSGRAGPDFSVTALTLDNHGSVLVDDAGLISVVAAPGDHTVQESDQEGVPVMILHQAAACH